MTTVHRTVVIKHHCHALLEFPLVRKVLIGFAIVSAAVCSADTIHLKSGRTIVADSVREVDGKIEYEIGDNTYRIPKSLVEKVETATPPPPNPTTQPSARPQFAAEPGKPVPVAPRSGSAEELRIGVNDPAMKAVHDGKVDLDVLNQLDASGNSNSAAAGYFLAGRFENEQGNREAAARYFERALGYAPDSAVILTHYSVLLIQTGRAREAINYAEHATLVAPNSGDAYAVLGYAYFSADHTRLAIEAWQRSVEIRPDEKVQGLLDKAKREMAAEATYSENDTGRFTLRYEGSATSGTFRQQLVSTLDRDYDDLSTELGITPRQNIPVILYTQQAFFDVTQAPTWTGALNDGKLRIPVRGLDYVTPELARVLKHELTHSFVNQAAAGRCPQWLNEGIAQMEEGRSLGPRGHKLAELYQQNSQISLNALEGSFLKFSSTEAAMTYDESLAAALYIRDTYGVSDIRRLLERTAQGGTFEQAMQDVLHMDYGRFEREVGDYLNSKYGAQ